MTKNDLIDNKTITDIHIEQKPFFFTGKSIKKVNLLSIRDYENPNLTHEYNKVKETMSNPNEQFVFHGCPFENLNEIYEKGFDLDKVGLTTGNLGHLGRGIYCSKRIEVAMYYCGINNNYILRPKFFLLCCKALLGKEKSFDMGECKVGCNLMEGYDSHQRKPSICETFFDDIYGKVQYCHQESVVFSKTNIVPMYLLELEIVPFEKGIPKQ